jgi:D-alanine--poly(phosphoribitol) ligase subunit 1
MMMSMRQSENLRRSLDRFFAESVRAHASRPALCIGERLWTYEELYEECGSIKQMLCSAGLESRQANIGVFSAKTPISYASIIAIMESNNVYVPLNPRFPIERILKMIQDAGIDTIIIDKNSVSAAAPLLEYGEILNIILPDCEENPFPADSNTSKRMQWRGPLNNTQKAIASESPTFQPAQFAYLMYTSGSTGSPKGVAITHENACAFIEKAFRLFNPDCSDRFTQFFELPFDLSICDIFLCWCSGACLYVPLPEDRLVPVEFIRRNNITIWGSVPSLANNIRKLNVLKKNTFPSIRLSWFCGEALPSELARMWSEAAPSSQVYNVYGPTETTIFATFYEYKPDESPATGVVPIGAPLPGLEYLLAADGEPVSQRVDMGELWLSGDQVVPGYWKKPAETSAAFVKGPDGDKVWYRTGDLVSLDARFGLMFHGRIDRQVKVNGHRVELQEVEDAIRRAAGCSIVAVLPVFSEGQICTHLVAFCDRLSGREAAVRKACAAHIPSYMVPARLVEIETFPFNSNGKLDYKKLSLQAKNIQAV